MEKHVSELIDELDKTSSSPWDYTSQKNIFNEMRSARPGEFAVLERNILANPYWKYVRDIFVGNTDFIFDSCASGNFLCLLNAIDSLNNGSHVKRFKAARNEYKKNVRSKTLFVISTLVFVGVTFFFLLGFASPISVGLIAFLVGISALIYALQCIFNVDYHLYDAFITHLNKDLNKIVKIRQVFYSNDTV